MQRCEETIDRFDTKWNRTAENTLVILSCTGEYVGTVLRNCSNGGMWDEPDYVKCISKSIMNIKQQVINVLLIVFSLTCYIIDIVHN